MAVAVVLLAACGPELRSYTGGRPTIPQEPPWKGLEVACVDTDKPPESIACPRNLFEDTLINSSYLYENCRILDEVCNHTAAEVNLEAGLCARDLRAAQDRARRLESVKWGWAGMGLMIGAAVALLLVAVTN